VQLNVQISQGSACAWQQMFGEITAYTFAVPTDYRYLQKWKNCWNWATFWQSCRKNRSGFVFSSGTWSSVDIFLPHEDAAAAADDDDDNVTLQDVFAYNRYSSQYVARFARTDRIGSTCIEIVTPETDIRAEKTHLYTLL